MIEVEKFDKDTSVEGAMSSLTLGQYFRSFLVKLSMIEAQLGQMYLGDEVSFAILIELKGELIPSTATGSMEPPPWIPANKQQTTSGASEDAELHIVRAVSTGIINLSLVVQESDVKLGLDTVAEGGPRVVTDKGKARAP